MSSSSSSVGLFPRDLITAPSSLVDTDPSPSLSNIMKVSLNESNSASVSFTEYLAPMVIILNLMILDWWRLKIKDQILRWAFCARINKPGGIWAEQVLQAKHRWQTFVFKKVLFPVLNVNSISYLFFRLGWRSQALLIVAHSTGLLKHGCGHCCQKFGNPMMIGGDFYQVLGARTGGGGRTEAWPPKLRAEADSKVYNHG